MSGNSKGGNAVRIVFYTPRDGGLEGEGKFVQLRWQGQEYWVFAPFSIHRYHNQIVGHFVKERGIGHHWPDRERLAIDDPGLRVLGGGRFRLDLARHRLEFWDDSQVYGRFDERGLAEKLASAGAPWDGLRLEVIDGK